MHRHLLLAEIKVIGTITGLLDILGRRVNKFLVVTGIPEMEGFAVARVTFKRVRRSLPV